MVNKLLQATIISSGTFLASLATPTLAAQGLGLGVGYGAVAGPTLELSYPINSVLQLRGALSTGMSVSDTATTNGIDYDVDSDGGVQRLALDYHPFNNGFFVSGGYAINNFELDALSQISDSQTITIGNTSYTTSSEVNLQGNLSWDNAPTLSLGWGHSPEKGFGFLIEAGAFFTGTPQVALDGTGTVNGNIDISDQIESDIRAEEQNLQDDVADYEVLPLLQAGISYRF